MSARADAPPQGFAYGALARSRNAASWRACSASSAANFSMVCVCSADFGELHRRPGKRIAHPVAGRVGDELAQLGGGMPSPAGVVEHAARELDEVRLALLENGFRLARLGYSSDRHGGDSGLAADSIGKWNLVVGRAVDLLLERHAAAARAYVVAAARLQFLGQDDRIFDVPASRNPVDGEILTPMGFSAGQTARQSSKISSAIRMRFSRDPPY